MYTSSCSDHYDINIFHYLDLPSVDARCEHCNCMCGRWIKIQIILFKLLTVEFNKLYLKVVSFFNWAIRVESTLLTTSNDYFTTSIKLFMLSTVLWTFLIPSDCNSCVIETILHKTMHSSIFFFAPFNHPLMIRMKLA